MDVGINFIPFRRISDIIGNIANSVEADKKVDPLELLPISSHICGKDRCVSVIAQSNVMGLAKLAARFNERKLFLNEERLTSCEDDLLDVRQKSLQVIPKVNIAIPLEAVSIDGQL